MVRATNRSLDLFLPQVAVVLPLNNFEHKVERLPLSEFSRVGYLLREGKGILGGDCSR